MAHVENLMGTKFGDAKKSPYWFPFVRARVSMPGMMDTVVNLGLTDEAVEGIAKKSRKPSFCMGLLPPFRSNVRRCRIGNETQKVKKISIRSKR